MVDRVVSVRFTADPSQYLSAVNKMKGANSGFGSSSAQAGDGISQFAKKALAVVGVGAAVKSTTAVFAGFQQSLNQLQAVGGATGAQMDQVSAKARELGKSIAGVSTQDAVDAMLELAKGGLSVDEAMAASTGTLNLAAAAQLSAADAATIQSAALNTFGLAASDANKVADILANTANAASGDITDFAQGLQQAGTPAAQLGISLEDTSTALGLFANNGIKGSDAGTSLKTMLISLLNPTKKAQDALDELGVNAFDAQGNFVGLEAVSGQLAEAQKNMSVEQFNAAAATAFGTDAVRAAAVFAKSGAEGYDELREAVGKAGGAQLMAAANTKGLAGAIDSVKAAVQDTQISLLQGLSPALEGTTRQVAAMIPQIAQALVPSLQVAGEAVLKVAQQALPLLITAAEAVAPVFTIAGNAISFIVPILTPLLNAVGNVVGVFAKLPGPLQAAALGLGALFLLNRRMTGFIGGLRQSGTAMTTFQRQVSFLQSRGVGAISAFTTVAGRRLSTLTGNFRTAAASAYATGGAMGAAGVGVRAFGTAAASAGRSLTAAFGGPIGIAIVGITTAMAVFASKSADADARTQELKSSVAGLDGELTKVTGKFDVLGKAALAVALSKNEQFFTTLGTSSAEAAEAISKGGAALDEYKARVLGSETALAGFAQNAVGASSKASEAVTGFKTVMGEVETQTKTTRDEFLSLAAVVQRGLAADVTLPELVAAFQSAETSGKSLQDVLAEFKITGPAADTAIGQMKDSLFAGGDGALYFSKSAADAKAGAEAVGGAAQTAGVKVETAATSADIWKAAYEAAEAPTRNFASALDDTKAAADSVQTAVDLMAAALLRSAGVNLTAEQAQRENAAAYRGITEGIYAQKRATEDLARSQADLKQAEADLKTGRAEGRKKDEKGAYTETDIEFAQRMADAERKVADAKRAVQDAQLKQQAAQTADREGYEKAAEAAANFASQATLTALANGNVSGAAKAGRDALAQQRTAFIDAAVAAGKSKDEAKKLADQYLATPQDVTTQFNALIDGAKKNGTELYRVYDSTTKTWSAQFLTKDEAAKASVQGLVQKYQEATGTFSARLTASEDGTVDRFLAKVQQIDGRTIRTNIFTNETTFVSRVGGPGSLVGGYTGGQIQSLPGFAAGGQFSGVVPGRSPANKRQDNMLAMLPNGKPLAVRSREFIVNEDSSMENLRALKFINGGGVIPGFATGGQFSASSLSGAPERTTGDREGRVISALEKIADAVQSVRDSYADLMGTAKEAYGKLADARGNARSTKITGDDNVKQVRSDRAEKNREAAKRVDDEEKKVEAAKALTQKTAADRVKRDKAIATAEAAATKARAAETKTRANSDKLITRAGSARDKANAAEAAKVAAASKNYNAAARAATAERRRLNSVEAIYKREQGLRANQERLARKYDSYATRIASTEAKLDELRDKRKGYQEDGKQTALGIRGGLLGSDKFEGKNVTAKDIRAQLASSLAGAKDFDKIVARAAGLGVSSDVLEQLKSDPEGRGGQILRGLAGGTKGDAKAINSLYSQIGAIGAGTGDRFSAAAGVNRQIGQTQNQLSQQKSVLADVKAALQDNGALMAATVTGALNGKEVTVKIGNKVIRGEASLVFREGSKAIAAREKARAKR